MKSFQAICLQFCVTLSAPFLTCHKNVAHTHSETLTVVALQTKLGNSSQTLPGCQSKSKLATRQGVTLINGVALLTPTSISVWLPLPPLPQATSSDMACPMPFYVYFSAKLFSCANFKKDFL